MVALLCQLLLSLAYLLANPAFEAPDEGDHYRYAFHLANARNLPVIIGTAADLGRPSGDELVQAYHPPLYYGLLALTLLASGHQDTVPSRLLNPEFGNWPDPRPSINLRYLHGWDERPPVSPEIRLLWLLRGWSVLLGLVAVWATHRLGRLAFPARPEVADGAALLLACLPKWTYLHGALTNDVPAADLSHLVVLLLAGGLAARRFAPRQAVLVGLLAGLAVLCKLTALFLGPVAAAAFAWGWLRWREQRRATLGAAALALFSAALVSSPFFVRNALLYGSPLALDVHEGSFAALHVPAGRLGEYLRHFLPEVFSSLLGQFGWKILPPLPALVRAGAALAGLAGLGLLLLALGRPRGRPGARGPVLALLAGVALTVYAVTFRYNLVIMGPFGRYLFPALGSLAVLVAAGLLNLLEGLAAPSRRRLLRVAALLPPAAAAWVLLASFRPAFDIGLAPAPAHHASLVEGVATAPARPTLTLLEPVDGARLAQPPLLRWSPAPAGPAEEPPLYTVHATDGRGRLLWASHELGRLEIREPRWQVPPEAWAVLPRGQEVRWKVRVVPDRRRGQTVEDVPGSGFAAFMVLPGS